MTSTSRSDEDPRGRRDVRPVARTALVSLGVLVIVVTLGTVVWVGGQVLLLVGVAIMFAVFLHGISDPLADRTPIKGKGAVAVAVALFLGAILAAGFLIGPRIVAQVQELSKSLPGAFESLMQEARDSAFGQAVLSRLPPPEEIAAGSSHLAGRIMGIFSTTLGAIGAMVLVFFVGLYLALQPEVYTEGLVKLLPHRSRDRAREILGALGRTLKYWIYGRLVAAAVIGVAVTVAYLLIGIPLALTLGLFAAVMTFIPNIGPIVAAVPAVLLALVQGPEKALLVVVVYTVIQVLESYVLTPYIERKAVSTPPALVLVAQVLFGALLGFLGLALATPLVAALLVLVKMAYVEDVLGDRTEFSGKA